MPDLTPERLARLRTWATRFDPDHPDQRDPTHRHIYDARCPWCRGDDAQPGEHQLDGSPHLLAIELLDEIDRLRATNQRLTDRILPLLDDPDEVPHARSVHALPSVSTASKTLAGWTAGTPVQLAGAGAAIWRVDPDEHQDPDSGRVVVTCGDVTLNVEPSVLTYVAPAPLQPGEQVHQVGSARNYGVLTTIIPGPDSDHPKNRLHFVKWDSDPAGPESGPFPRTALERPADLALRWGLATAVADHTGRVGHTVAVDGAAVAARWDSPEWPPVITWHHISTLQRRDP